MGARFVNIYFINFIILIEFTKFCESKLLKLNKIKTSHNSKFNKHDPTKAMKLGTSCLHILLEFHHSMFFKYTHSIPDCFILVKL